MQAHHERDAQGVMGAHCGNHVEYVNTATLRTSKVHFLINFDRGDSGHAEAPVRELLLRSGASFVRGAV